MSLAFIPGAQGVVNRNSLHDSAVTRVAAEKGAAEGATRMTAAMRDAVAAEGVSEKDIADAARDANPYFRLAAETKAKELAKAEGVDVNATHINAARDQVTQADMEAAVEAYPAHHAAQLAKADHRPHLAAVEGGSENNGVEPNM